MRMHVAAYKVAKYRGSSQAVVVTDNLPLAATVVLWPGRTLLSFSGCLLLATTEGFEPPGTLVATVWDFRGELTYQRPFRDMAAGIDPRALTPVIGCSRRSSPSKIDCRTC